MMKYIYLAMLLFVSQVDATVKHIFFEIDDVLFKVSEMEVIKNIPILARIGEKLAESYTNQYLELMAKDHTYDYVCKNTKVLFRNKRVPSLLCAFFLGIVSTEEAHKRAHEIISNNLGWFDVISKAAFRYAADSEFDAKHEINYMFPIEEAHALVAKLSKNPENKLYVFSNKNSGTLNNLKRRYPSYFAPFQGRIIISGETKKLKPSMGSYKHLFEKYNIDPADAYFIEAQRGYIEPVKSIAGAKYARWSKDTAHEIEKALLR